MLFAVDETLQVRWKRSTSMKSMWTQGNTETFQPSQAGSRIEQNQTTENTEARGEDGKTKSRRLLFHSLCPFTFQILSVVSPLSASCLSLLVSAPPRRIAAVKLLTSSSTSVMTLHSAVKLSVYVCARLSVRVFDVFIRISHDLGLNHGFRKEGEFPLSCVPLCTR